MNRRKLLKSLLVLPFVPSMFRNIITERSLVASTADATNGWIELKGAGTGGIEFIPHEQVSAGHSFWSELPKLTHYFGRVT